MRKNEGREEEEWSRRDRRRKEEEGQRRRRKHFADVVVKYGICNDFLRKSLL